MVYSVVELLNRNKPEVNRAIDLTLSNRSATGGTYVDGMPDPWMMTMIPETSYMTLEAAFMKFLNKKPTLAFIRGENGEVITDRETIELTEDRVGNCNISRGVIWTESDFRTIKKIDDLRRSGGAGNIRAATELLDAYKTTPVRLTQSWANTLFMLCQRVQVCGEALYTDPRSNIEVELDYTGDIPSVNMPAALTGTDRWSQLTTADGIDDLATHLNNHYAITRQFPPAVAMGNTEADNLRNQNSTKLRVALLKDRGATISDPANLPPATLEEVQEALRLELTSSAQSQAQAPKLVVSDAVWYQRNLDGTVSSGLFLPAGYYAFVYPGMVEAARFPTVTNDWAGGLAIVTDPQYKLLPREEFLAIDGCGIPLVPDGRYLAARNVENTALS